MEPRQVGFGTSPERAPQQPEVTGMPEYGIPGGPERPSMSPEVSPRPVEGSSTPPITIPVLPLPIIPQDDSATQTVVVQGTAPVVAADEDLIEKEWVDQAKKIIEETKDDPYRREQEVGKLQREYIKKRYGRAIGETGE